VSLGDEDAVAIDTRGVRLGVASDMGTISGTVSQALQRGAHVGQLSAPGACRQSANRERHASGSGGRHCVNAIMVAQPSVGRTRAVVPTKETSVHGTTGGVTYGVRGVSRAGSREPLTWAREFARALHCRSWGHGRSEKRGRPHRTW
jgi:hypothetical protein